jgi:hypothetical protein
VRNHHAERDAYNAERFAVLPLAASRSQCFSNHEEEFMTGPLRLVFTFVTLVLAAQLASAQESKAAKATREKLKQMIAEFDVKETGAKNFFDEINDKIDKEIKFKIDNNSGISNNTKLSFKAKNVTVEKLLNDVSDKFEIGWVVISNPGNNKVDGWVIIRKSDKGKERGYEFGKEPKKESSWAPLPPDGRFPVAELRSSRGISVHLRALVVSMKSSNPF